VLSKVKHKIATYYRLARYKIVGAIRHLTERCWHCGRQLHKTAFERQGYLYCSKLCAVKVARVDDPHRKYVDIVRECNELHRR
jgi:hypothetical protein